MSFFAQTIPQVTYDRTHYDELMRIKLQLLRLLKQNMISSLPPGFPFHCRPDTGGRHSMSYASYEFQQVLNPSGHSSRPQSVTFKYTASSPNSGSRMEWRITVPNTLSIRYKNAPETMIAQVQVDPMVMQIPLFGLRFMTESRIIQEALAITLELGVVIIIEVANRQTYKYPRRHGIQFTPGQIIFRTTDCHGRDEVVFVYQ